MRGCDGGEVVDVREGGVGGEEVRAVYVVSVMEAGECSGDVPSGKALCCACVECVVEVTVQFVVCQAGHRGSQPVREDGVEALLHCPVLS